MTGRAERPVSDLPALDYATSARTVIEAFGVAALIEGSMYLPEVQGRHDPRGAHRDRIHLVDYVAHGWDVAKSLGIATEFDDDALQVALTVAEAVPAEARTLGDRTSVSTEPSLHEHLNARSNRRGSRPLTDSDPPFTVSGD